MGKFFAILLQVVICLALTLPYYITIASLGNVDHAVGFCGYLGHYSGQWMLHQYRDVRLVPHPEHDRGLLHHVCYRDRIRAFI